MLYCDAATFCRRRNDAGIMTDETGRRCAQESIDIIIMKNNYYYLFIKNNFDYLLNQIGCRLWVVGCWLECRIRLSVFGWNVDVACQFIPLYNPQPKTNNPQPKTYFFSASANLAYSSEKET